MKKTYFEIGKTPAVLYGGEADRVFLYVHGLCGNKEEAERFAEIACPLGWQVLGIDLPEHGGRQDGVCLVPWEVLPELREVHTFLRTRYETIGIRANSIGAYFSLLACGEETVAGTALSIGKCLLVSPLLDMEGMIGRVCRMAGVTEKELCERETVVTSFGATLSYRYLCYARSHPVRAVCPATEILYAAGDEQIPREEIDRFARENPSSCRLTVTERGEHWFHTDEELAILERWETACISG